MKSISNFLGRFFRYLDEKLGVSTVEYALIVVAVVGIVGVAASMMGDAFEDLFTDLQTELGDSVANTKSAAAPAPPAPPSTPGG